MSFGHIRLGLIEVVVVYKVDRLMRSLADFAKIVELFDQHQVSFVAVTQQFNTTNSMGRLREVRKLKMERGEFELSVPNWLLAASNRHPADTTEGMFRTR